ALAKQQDWLGQNWWFLVTIAEAYFGLGRYGEASEWLEQAKRHVIVGGVPDWELETASRQLANLARLRAKSENISDAELEQSPAWATLKNFLEIEGRDYAAGLRSAFVGKIGLGLSGGGFRASLFHIGVLAKLAERDLLRGVEVLSCVSGGAIIGAHYYLEVRKLLEEKSDAEITREDYIEIVRRIEREFLAGVQRNLRVRVLAEWWTGVKTIFKRNYSHTERLGELYERELFSRVADGGEDEPRWLDRLLIHPKGESDNFLPRRDNWRRTAKAPILILNAATVNTGHNWQFTATWMGEPAASINTEVDGNAQLRRMYYEDAPPGYRRFRLGRAVAASSCVPILFDPITLEGLFPDMKVRLVDGGVHDNQGVAGLLEQGCTALFISDASGQIETEKCPGAGRLKIAMRSLDMLMARVREAQYVDLDSRRDAGLLRGFLFVHLKKDLDVEPLSWIGCQDPFDAYDESRPVERRGPLTSYGIRKDVQERLAAIRTDLDAFSDTEAFALMTSGYLMTERELSRATEPLWSQPGERINWRFLALEEPMKTVSDPTLMMLLQVAESRGLKVWRVSRPLRRVTYFLAALATVVIGASVALSEIGMEDVAVTAVLILFFGYLLLIVLAVFAVPVALLLLLFKLFGWSKAWSQIVVGVLLSVLGGWVLFRVKLHLLDKIYLAKGDIGERAPRAQPELSSTPSAPRNAVKAVHDRLESARAAAPLIKVIDRAATVEAVGKLFEALGFAVTRFPRDYAINPLQIDLDLYARRPVANGGEGEERILVIVKTGAESPDPVDWRTASNLESATWLVGADEDDKGGNGASPDEAANLVSSPPTQALLVLIGVPAHESLNAFIDNGSVKLLSLNADEVKWISERKAGEPELRERAEQKLVALFMPRGDVPASAVAIGGLP
ncbi:MAG: patatin-like phospholipase family protein, partial [Acidobacteriota bacterium]|nr:patatin-like phospholipase family protein [Acidobacteriota bacterium]